MAPRPDPMTIFSGDKYRCLDYYHVDTISDSDKDLICECLDDAIVQLLEAIHYEHRIAEHDLPLRLELEKWGTRELTKATGRNMTVLKQILGQGASCVEYFFPHAAPEYRLLMAKCTATVITLDDYLTESSTKAEVLQLQSRVWQGHPQQDDWCSLFVDLTTTYATYYGARDPLVGSLATSAWSGFLNGVLQEDRLRVRSPIHQPPATKNGGGSTNGNGGSTNGTGGGSTNGHVGDGEFFPWFLRSQSGVPLPYIITLFNPSPAVEVPLQYWLKRVPDLMTFINMGNDLLSFQKEVLDNENENYVALFTQIKRESGQLSRFHCDGTLWTVRDTVCHSYERVLKSILMLDQTFNALAKESQEEDLQVAAKLWKDFKSGYIGWHINCGRYGLKTLRSLFLKSNE